MLRESRQLVTRKLRGSWRRRQQVREEVTGKLVPVEFELKQARKFMLLTSLPADVWQYAAAPCPSEAESLPPSSLLGILQIDAFLVIYL